MSELPPQFLTRMQQLLGEEYPAFMASLASAPITGLRVNTLKITTADFERLASHHLQRVLWCQAGYIARESQRHGKHPYHAAGLYYIQEPSAMAVAETLDPQPGECVLDLAAAPGGKTTHIASLMKGEGVIVANEVHPRRVWELAQNLERWGAHNVIITNESPQRLTGSFSDTFDRVLLDAPCSGEGMFRRSETARGEWSPSLVTSCARRQSAILDEAARMVRPGGILLYTTCTFAPEENEGVIAHFLAQHSDFHLVEIPVTHGFSAGRPGWGEQNGAFPELRYTARLWPHRLSGEGHFIAKLQRKDYENTGQTSRRPFRLSKIPVHVKQYCQDFWLKNMATELDAGHLHLQGSYLYQIPPDAPDLSGLKVIHPGWWLGSMRQKRFEPSHALALGIRASDARLKQNLETHTEDQPLSEQVIAYLTGANQPSSGEDGWVLVTVDGFPLGWGKRSKEILKSHYPGGLRRMASP